MDINSLIDSDPERLGGAVCFVGTRVPIHNLFDYLAANQPLTDFLDDFPTVTLAQVEAVLRLASEHLETHVLGRLQHDEATGTYAASRSGR